MTLSAPRMLLPPARRGSFPQDGALRISFRWLNQPRHPRLHPRYPLSSMCIPRGNLVHPKGEFEVQVLAGSTRRTLPAIQSTSHFIRARAVSLSFQRAGAFRPRFPGADRTPLTTRRLATRMTLEKPRQEEYWLHSIPWPTVDALAPWRRPCNGCPRRPWS